LPYSFYQAIETEINAAAQAAKAAFCEYRQMSTVRRAEFLYAIADELDQLGDDFVAIVCQETALSKLPGRFAACGLAERQSPGT
jgi:NADP-dependent aldehyde dehydrogenase